MNSRVLHTFKRRFTLARFDARKIKQVAHQLVQTLAIFATGTEHFYLFIVQLARGAFQQQMHAHLHAGQRRAQLVEAVAINSDLRRSISRRCVMSSSSVTAPSRGFRGRASASCVSEKPFRDRQQQAAAPRTYPQRQPDVAIRLLRPQRPQSARHAQLPRCACRRSLFPNRISPPPRD